MINMAELTFTVLISFLMILIMGPIFIPLLTKFKFGQTIREEGPKSHMIKSGTPTMGGIMIIIAILLAVIIKVRLNINMIVGLLSIVGFGLIGFLDDFLKIKNSRNLGLRAYQKIVLQLALSFIIAMFRYKTSINSTQLTVPFTSFILNSGFMYVPVMMFIIIATVNAVNLSDGLDGLASSITSVVSVFYMIMAVVLFNNMDVGILSAATFGACLGFLCFNINPAKVFMGDTGSMALGGAVVAFAVFTNTALLIPFIGGIYFAEALSVIIQVIHFKRTGRRIFRMSPLHHHFEQGGWKETKVVSVFLLAQTILALISVIAIM